MKKLVRNIIIGGTAIGVGAALIRFKKYKKNVLENEEEKVSERKYYELGENNTKRKYIKLWDVNKDKIERLSIELETVKEKKKTM